ncbi:ABC transporter substrate-binding protein [Ornithinibacillus sp. 4-3]|uniref:ABC transporter substrate-binding protein n=1 Tax=Ornithinibacillus sp. 4-3 TaxID=3231488 RepID=A0AB39HNS5_9BACI
MKRSNLFKFLGAFMLLLVLIACSDSDNADENGDSQDEIKSGGELNLAFPSQPPTLDNHLTTMRSTVEVTRHIFETLVTYDSDYNVVPMLAESWDESEDGLTYTFHLREGVKFHNGEEMTADDVVASMNRWLENSGAGKETFTDAVFTKIDDQTVQLELQSPVSITLAILAFNGANLASIMPAEIAEAAGDENVSEYIGTGPFQFEEWKQDQYIHLSKFDDYVALDEPSDKLAGKKEALVDDLYFHYVSDSHTTLSGLMTGEYDVASSVSFDGIDQIKNDENIVIDSAPDMRMSLYFNKKKGLFADPVARKAIAVGINNDDILLASFANPEYYGFTHHLMMYHQEEQWYSDIGKDLFNQNDVEEAKQLLEEAGYDGEEITLMVGRDHDYIYNASVVLQEQLEQMGINTKLAVYDSATVTELRDDENAYDLYMKSDTPRSEPTSLLFMKSSYSGWTDSPELEELLQDFWGQPNLESAIDLYDDLQEWYTEYLPIIKIGDGNALYAYRSNIQGIEWMDGLMFWNTGFTE